MLSLYEHIHFVDEQVTTVRCSLYILESGADPGTAWADRAPPIEQKWGLVMAARRSDTGAIYHLT